jgi:hypothetical protein
MKRFFNVSTHQDFEGIPPALLRQSHQFFVAQFLLFSHLRIALREFTTPYTGLDAKRR